MKRIALTAALLALCALALAGRQDIIEVTHFSKALNQEKTMFVYVPTVVEPGDKFPTLFILHGAYGGYADWVDRTAVCDLAEHFRMILVFPDGEPFSWYVNSPIETDSQYETYLSEELPAFVDRVFPTVGKREARGIMGLSMGGHGAMLMAAKHPDVFGSASSLSGILQLSVHPDKWHIAGQLGSHKDNYDVWVENSVLEQAERFKDTDVKLLFDCGEDDTRTSAIQDARNMHKRLVELEIPHIWREMPGTHSWAYWDEHLEEHLNFHQASMIEFSPGFKNYRKHFFELIGKYLDENAQIEIAEAPPSKMTVSLVGSSSLEAFPMDKLSSDYIYYNRGIGSDTLGVFERGISHRMESSIFDMKPDVVIIKNGLNDLGDRGRSGKPTIDQMIQEYEEIIQKIQVRSPETKIIIFSATPVSGRFAHLTPGAISYNKQLQMLAKKHDIPFVDIFTPLADDKGELRTEYTKDGLHFLEEPYNIWAAKLVEELGKLEEQ